LVNRANIGDFSQNKKYFPRIISGVQAGCIPAGVPQHVRVLLLTFAHKKSRNESGFLGLGLEVLV